MTTVSNAVPALPPVRRSTVVRADVETCWIALTERIGSWWPLLGHSCSDDPHAVLGFADDELVETGPDGTRWRWGTVLRREPPHGLVMTWHPGKPAGSGEITEVEWRLSAVDPGTTLVEVVHRGWERLADPGLARTMYEAGWPAVVAALAVLAARLGTPAG